MKQTTFSMIFVFCLTGSRASAAGSSSKSASKTSQEGDKKKMTDPLTVLQQDWREYKCITWQLEPTVR